MARLPTLGGDVGSWGTVLNEYALSLATMRNTHARIFKNYYIGDDFNRPDTTGGTSGTNNGVGNGWLVTGAGYLTARISGGGVIADDTIYIYQQLPFTPTRMNARISFPSGTTRPFALISSPDNGLFVNAVHVVYGPTVCYIQKRVGNVSTNLATINVTIPTDGSYHNIAWEVSGNTVSLYLDTVLMGTGTDTQVPSLMGPWCSWEFLGTPAGASPRFNLIEALKVIP